MHSVNTNLCYHFFVIWLQYGVKNVNAKLASEKGQQDKKSDFTFKNQTNTKAHIREIYDERKADGETKTLVININNRPSDKQATKK